MKQGTKQRIVGAIVLLCLALIFLPIIFDGDGSYQVPISSRIPEPPVVQPMPDPMPTRPVIINEPVNTTITQDDTLVAEDLPAETVADDSLAESEAAPEAVAPEDQTPAEVAVVESQPAFTRETPTLNADGLPEGWSVRLGAFSDASNASALLQRLQDSGYKAYSRNASNDQGELTVIYVGPWLERAMADDYLDELRAQFQLSGLVVRYELQQL